MSATLIPVPVAQIIDGLNNRSNLGDLTALAANIRENGNIQPPDYRRLPDGRYQIVAGHRRTAAMILNGQTEIMAMVSDDLSDETAISRMLSENNCRVAVNPMDEATGLRASMDRFGWDVATCASKAGVSVATVNNRLLLLNLCEDVADLVKRGIVSVSYGQAIGRAGLNRNFQNLACDALRSAVAPTLAWFGTVLDELSAKQNAPDDMFGGLYTVDQLETVQATNEPTPPLPDTHDAPALGDTPVAILQGQIAYWQAAGAAWANRGKPNEAKRCHAAASSLNRALVLVQAMQPAPTVAPVVYSPMPKPSMVDAIRGLLGDEPQYKAAGDGVTVLGLPNVQAARLTCERAGYQTTVISGRLYIEPAPPPQVARKGRTAPMWRVAQQLTF